MNRLLHFFRSMNPPVIFKSGVVCILLSLLSACELLTAEPDYHSRRSWVISEMASILVLPPNQEQLQPRFAHRVQLTLAAALEPNFAQVKKSYYTQPVSVAQALRDARRSKHHYLVLPVVIDHKDRTNSMAEIIAGDRRDKAFGADRAALKFALYEVDRGELIDTSFIELSSSWSVFGGGDSETLFRPMMEAYANRLSAINSLQ